MSNVLTPSSTTTNIAGFTILLKIAEEQIGTMTQNCVLTKKQTSVLSKMNALSHTIKWKDTITLKSIRQSIAIFIPKDLKNVNILTIVHLLIPKKK